MPETAMDEDRLAQPWEGQIWAAGKIPPMESEPVAKPVRETPDDELRLRILLANTRHSEPHGGRNIVERAHPMISAA